MKSMIVTSLLALVGCSEASSLPSTQLPKATSSAPLVAAKAVEEGLEPGASVSLVARRHGVNPNQLFTWRRLAAHGALTAAAAGEEVVPASEHRALQQQIRELHRLLGKKTLEAEILKEALQHAGPKKRLLLRGPLPPRDSSR